MKRFTVLAIAAALLAACSKSPTAAPTGHDPVVLIVSQNVRPILFIWAPSGGRTFDTVTIAPGTTSCQIWTQATDSVYWQVRDSTASAWSIVTSPWLSIKDDAPYYADTVSSVGGSLQFVHRLSLAPC